jgi:riboflavin kinase/FMN adenylyltransferase
VLLPKFGVYGSLLDIFGITYKGITNIGVKPTVEEKKIPLVETNIINFDGNLYGETLKVRLKTFVRPEMKFNGLDELKNQIETDKNSWTNMN